MDAFTGEIRMFAGNFNIKNWAFCDGTLLPIHDFEALYSLIQNTYGGNGITNFALPDLRGRIPVSVGRTSPTSMQWNQGTCFGVETVQLQANMIPTHTHSFMASQGDGGAVLPQNAVLGDTGVNFLYEVIDGDEQITQLSPDAIQPTGTSAPHSNMMPSLAISFIICTNGEYPNRP